jgi:hypothetical protein
MRLPLAIAAGLLACAARADSPPAPSDSISDAKKDLAQIRAPSPGQDLGASLQGAGLKDIGAVPGGVHAEAPPAIDSAKEAGEPPGKKEGTGNWLVDAMDKQAEREHSGKAKEKDEQLKEDLALIRGEDRKPDRDNLLLEEPKERDAPPREEAEKAVNPLDSFMSSWVAPRDRELLLTRADPARSDTLPGLDAPQAPGAPDLLPAGAPDPATFAEPPALNPYVAALELPEAPALRLLGPAEPADFAQAALPDLSRGISSGAPDARPGDSRSFIPDFAQPSDDDKYFKQLKRF